MFFEPTEQVFDDLKETLEFVTEMEEKYVEIIFTKANEIQERIVLHASELQEYIPLLLTKGNEIKERMITIAITSANDIQEKYIPNMITKGYEFKDQIITKANQLAHPEELLQAGLNHIFYVLPHLTVLLSVAFVLLLSSPIWLLLWIINLIVPLKYILIFTGEVTFVQLSSWWALPTLFDVIFIFLLEKPLTLWGFFKSENGFLLEKASHRMCQHEHIVIRAIQNNPWELKFASQKLKNKSEVVKKAVEKNGLTLQFASKEVRSNFDVVFEAIKSHGLSLKFSSPDLSNDQHLVLNAVKQNALAIKYASKNCKDNFQIAKNAVKKNSLCYRFISDRLQQECVILMLRDGIPPEYAFEVGMKKIHDISFKFN
jgi:hypothetical protein